MGKIVHSVPKINEEFQVRDGKRRDRTRLSP